MFRSRHSRRVLLALFAVVLLTTAISQLAAGSVAQFWLPLAVGVIAAAAAAAFVLRPLSEITEQLRAGPDSEPAMHRHSSGDR